MSYRLVENPIRGLQVASTFHRLLLVVAVVLVPVLVGLAVKTGANAQWGMSPPDRPVFGSGGVSLANCMRFTRTATASPIYDPACSLAQGSRSVYLVGDSQAAQWGEALAKAASAQGASLTVATAPGCPFLDVYLSSPAGTRASDQACRENYEATMTALRSADPGEVFIAESFTYWSDPQVGISTDGGRPAYADGAKSAAMNEGLSSTVADLKSSGLHVTVVLPTLRFIDYPYQLLPTSCSTVAIFRGQCYEPVSVSQAPWVQLRARDSLAAAAAAMQLPVVDPVPEQCPEALCPLWVSDIPVYSHGTHVSAEFSGAVWPIFTGALAPSRD